MRIETDLSKLSTFAITKTVDLTKVLRSKVFNAKVEFPPVGYKARILCIFHEDKNESLAIYANGYYCFGCRAKGDTIAFVMAVTGVTFPQAVDLIREAAEETDVVLDYDVVGSAALHRSRALEILDDKPRAERFRWWCKVLNGKPFGKWDIIPDEPDARSWAINRGAGFFTALQVDRPESPCWYFGNWYIDLDGSREDTLRDYTNAIATLRGDSQLSEAKKDQIKAWDTGGRGYHIEVKTNGNGPLLPLTYARLTASLQLPTADLSIYNLGRGRLWRIEGLVRPNGKRKTRIL